MKNKEPSAGALRAAVMIDEAIGDTMGYVHSSKFIGKIGSIIDEEVRVDDLEAAGMQKQIQTLEDKLERGGNWVSNLLNIIYAYQKHTGMDIHAENSMVAKLVEETEDYKPPPNPLDIAEAQLAAVMKAVDYHLKGMGCGNDVPCWEADDGTLCYFCQLQKARSSLPDSIKGKVPGELKEGFEQILLEILESFGKSSSWYWRLKKLVDALPENIKDKVLVDKGFQKEIDYQVQRAETLQAENERLRKAAVHFEQKAVALQGIIDRIKSNFKAVLRLKP